MKGPRAPKCHADADAARMRVRMLTCRRNGRKATSFTGLV